MGGKLSKKLNLFDDIIESIYDNDLERFKELILTANVNIFEKKSEGR